MSNIKKYQQEVPENGARPETPAPSSVKALNRKTLKNKPEESLYPPSLIKSADHYLHSLLGGTFFFDLFENVAERCDSDRKKANRIANFKCAHPCVFKTCFVFDFVFRFIILSALTFFCCFALYKIVIK